MPVKRVSLRDTQQAVKEGGGTSSMLHHGNAVAAVGSGNPLTHCTAADSTLPTSCLASLTQAQSNFWYEKGSVMPFDLKTEGLVHAGSSATPHQPRGCAGRASRGSLQAQNDAVTATTSRQVRPST